MLRTMKKQLSPMLLMIACLWCWVDALAIPANPKPYIVTQPDGTTINVRLCGDEYYHYYTTEDGSPITLCDDGYYRYTTIDAQNNLVASADAVGKVRASVLSDKKAVMERHNELYKVNKAKRVVNMQNMKSPMRNVVNKEASNKGVVKGIIVLAEFQDQRFTFTQSTINQMMNKEGYTDVYGSIGSARDYFIAQSYGQFQPEFDVVGPVTLSQNMSYYGANENGNDIRPHEMVAEACQLASQQELADMSDYDHNGDGYVDIVYVIYAGYPESSGADSSTIWPHAWYVYSGGGLKVNIDGVILDRYACSAELYGNSGSNPCGIGTFCHEYSHTLGLPDWYDIDYSGGMGMSWWSIMASGSYGINGYVPVGYNAYERELCGWLEFNELTEDSYITMPELNTDKTAAYKITSTNANQYITLETRCKKGWDMSLPSEGMMVIAVDYDYYAWIINGPNDDPERQRFKLIPADNSWSDYDLYGDLYPYGGNRTLSSTSLPKMQVHNTIINGKSITGITYNNGVTTFDFENGVVSGDEVPSEIEGVYNAFANSGFYDQPNEEWQVEISIDKTDKNKVWIRPLCMFAGFDAEEISAVYATYNALDNTLIMPLGQTVYEDSYSKLVIAQTLGGSDINLTDNIVLQINKNKYDIEISFANNYFIGVGDILNNVWWYQALYNFSYTKTNLGEDDVPAKIEGIYNAFANSGYQGEPDQEWQVEISIDKTNKGKVWIQPICMFGGLEAEDISPVYATYNASDNTLIMPLGQVLFENSGYKMVIAQTTNGSDKNLTNNIVLQINDNAYGVEISFADDYILGVGDILNDNWWYQALYNISYTKTNLGGDDVPAKIEGIYNAFANSGYQGEPDQEWQVEISIDKTNKGKVWIQPICMFGGLEAEDISPVYATYNASDNTLIMPLGQVLFENSGYKMVIAQTTNGSDKNLTNNIVLQINDNAYGVEISFADDYILGVGDILNDNWWYQALYNISYTKTNLGDEIATSITLDKSEINLEATQTAKLVATVLPETTTNKTVTWKSSDKTIATVDENGVVTAIAVGEANITATTNDGSNLTASCKVIVNPTLATSIALDKTEVELETTQTATLVATVLPELTTNKSATWMSSDESVAMVDENGVVTAIAVGEAIITATTVDGSNLSATCKVTVIPTLVVSIEVTPNVVEAEENSEVQLSVIILPEDATCKSVEWSSSNDAIASVDANGLVTMHSAGDVIITATTTDGTNLSATCRINVYSGVNEVSGDNVVVATIGDNIVVRNARLGGTVNVYASNGALVKSVTATDGSVVIEAPMKDIYVVVVDGKSYKVIAK